MPRACLLLCGASSGRTSDSLLLPARSSEPHDARRLPDRHPPYCLRVPQARGYTASTPSRARPRLGLSAKSAITAPTSADALAASSGERYIALRGLLDLRTSCRTAPPALPEAPLTSIIATSLKSHQRLVHSAPSAGGVTVAQRSAILSPSKRQSTKP